MAIWLEGNWRSGKAYDLHTVSSMHIGVEGVTDPVARVEMLRSALKLTNKNTVSGKKVLLVDDLYRSGATLRIAADLLYKEGKASAVSVLTMTKTRSIR